MNAVFLDFEGVLWPDVLPHNCDYNILIKEIEKKIIILKSICDELSELNLKFVLSSSYNEAFDPETLKPIIDNEDFGLVINAVYNLFQKYGIDIVGVTQRVEKILSKSDRSCHKPMWKEDEIRLYLLRHPEIEHYCVIDDDDMINAWHWKKSDLDKVRKHLVMPKGHDSKYHTFEDPNYEIQHFDDLGLTLDCKDEVAKVLKLENNINKYRKRA